MSLSKTKPGAAFDMALAWEDFGGGKAAGHCVATSLFGLKIYKEAAMRLEDLARSTDKSNSIQIELLSQAAQAWFLNGNLNRAESILNIILSIQPKSPQLLVDRAIVYASMAEFNKAIDDLTLAIEYKDNFVDGFVYRASAYRHLKNYNAAELDIEKALKLNPVHLEGLLERGIIRNRNGEKILARKDWLKILEIAPNTSVAVSAQNNLEKMDLKTRN